MSGDWKTFEDIRIGSTRSDVSEDCLNGEKTSQATLHCNDCDPSQFISSHSRDTFSMLICMSRHCNRYWYQTGVSRKGESGDGERQLVTRRSRGGHTGILGVMGSSCGTRGEDIVIHEYMNIFKAEDR